MKDKFKADSNEIYEQCYMIIILLTGSRRSCIKKSLRLNETLTIFDQEKVLIRREF